MLRALFLDGPAHLVDLVTAHGQRAYLPTRWDRYVPRVLTIPWLIAKTYLVLAGAFLLSMYLLHRIGLPSLWPT
jgi:hypothetical protein